MNDTDVGALTAGLVAQARREIADAYHRDAERPTGALALDIDFYSKADRSKPIEDYDFYDASGRHWKGTGARWCVVKVRWDGSEWKRVRRITGPLLYTPALDRLYEESRRRGLERRP